MEKEKVGFNLASRAGILEVGALAKLEGGVPLTFVVISFFSGLEVEGWLKEARDLWTGMGLEDMGEVGACDDMESVVGGAVPEEGSLKEKFETGPAE